MDQKSPIKQTPEKRDLHIVHHEYFEGPLPHPQILEKYEKIFPGATERLISMAEQQSKHRQELEKSVIYSNIFTERVGMYSAVLITIVSISSGTYLIIMNKEITGFITLISTLAFHMFNYLNRKQKEKQALKRNQEADETRG